MKHTRRKWIDERENSTAKCQSGYHESNTVAIDHRPTRDRQQEW